MHVIKPQPVITSYSFSFAISQRGKAAASAASSGDGGGEGKGTVPRASPETKTPPLPRTIRLQQVPEGQTVHFNKLWVTVFDKSPTSTPRSAAFPDMWSHTMYGTHVLEGEGGGNKHPFMPH